MKLKNCSLRKLKENDLPIVLEWRNSEKVRPYMFSDHLITEKEHQEWFANIKNSKITKYYIFEVNGEPAGLSSFINIDETNRTCEWGFYIGLQDSKPGLGTILAKTSINHAFKKLKVKVIFGRVLVFNKPSCALFEKMGFRKESLLKEHVIKNGIPHDVVIYKLNYKDWLKQRSINNEE